MWRTIEFKPKNIHVDRDFRKVFHSCYCTYSNGIYMKNGWQPKIQHSQRDQGRNAWAWRFCNSLCLKSWEQWHMMACPDSIYVDQFPGKDENPDHYFLNEWTKWLHLHSIGNRPLPESPNCVWEAEIRAHVWTFWSTIVTICGPISQRDGPLSYIPTHLFPAFIVWIIGFSYYYWPSIFIPLLSSIFF